MSGGLRTSDYEYDLPPGRIARYPADRREGSRLLVLDRAGGEIGHRLFPGIVDLLSPEDLMVVNESRVVPARLLGRKPTGARVEVLLLRPRGGASWSAAREWEALVRPGSKLKPGRRVEVAPGLQVSILDSLPTGGRVVELHTDLPPLEALDRFGHVPLPPYIQREDEPIDRERYQTVYARTPGSVAAPTAGLHFSDDLLQAIEAKGVRRAMVTLHVGLGTFRPVESADPREHPMHEEAYEIPQATVDAIGEARARGGRVWAVGTTVVRALEGAADREGTVRVGVGSTDLFIRPGYSFRVVEALLTNFHLPRSTLLMLVAAFAGYERVMAAYEEAIREGYRFYSYGDAMAVV